MGSLYTDNLKGQYKTLQRNLVIAHFESKILPHLSEDLEIYWGMGVYGIEDSTGHDYLPPDLADSMEDCLEVVFPFYNKELDPVYAYLEILDSATNKVSTKLNPSECDKLKVCDYLIMHM
ncbi:conserved hypothetical protein [Vibrio phage 501E54-1]|nr:conserved hypothetical protein [Vibrio phage 501E54-1]